MKRRSLVLMSLCLVVILSGACQNAADKAAGDTKATSQPVVKAADKAADKAPPKLALPAGWPKNVPAQYTRDHFQPIIEDAIVKAGVNVRLAGFDCTQVPCIAKLENFEKDGKAPVIASSGKWKMAYGGDVILSYSGLVNCPDGKEVRIELLSPFWDGQNDPVKAGPDFYAKQRAAAGVERTKAERAMMSKLRPRWTKIQEGWICK